MKILIFYITLCVLAAKLTFAISSEESRLAFIAAGDECSKQFTIDADEMKKFQTHELLSTHNGKCYQTCVMKKLGVLTADNKASKEGFLLGISLIHPSNDPEINKLAEEVYAECAEVTDADECEASNKVAGCLKEGKMKRGLE